MAKKRTARRKTHRTSKKSLHARRSVGGLKTYAKKLIGKRFDNVTIERFIIPEGQTKKDALAAAKKIAQVPWSGKKGTVMFYGTARTTDGIHTNMERVTFTNPFRKGKVRKTVRRLGTIFKRKGRTYIVTRLRNGVKVARPYVRRHRRH